VASRFFGRVQVVCAALPGALRRRRPVGAPARVLIAHHPKMIGDTILMSALAAKARHAWPQAEIVMTASPATRPLYQHRPWNVESVAFDPAEAATLAGFRRAGGYDLALLPGDNRYGWFARAVGTRWVRGFGGDRPRWKNRLLDEARAYPSVPGCWADMAADLVDAADPPPYTPSQWASPGFRDYASPASDYAVIHLGASTTLKRWQPERWNAVAQHLESKGIEVVWSAGPGEQRLVAEVDPQQRRRSYAGVLDLAQMWNLIERAKVLVTPDTGLAHLARLTFTPTVALFGPGTTQTMGNGRFFRDAPWSGVMIEPWPCRDQPLLYKREVAWVRRCARSAGECASPACMHAIGVGAVTAAVGALVPGLA
jgi:ADP-heptose:LPS heptosyltransferase